MPRPYLYPLLLNPSLHPKPWGGRKLETLLDKHLPTDEPYGEAWELHDTATVANGELAGRSIGDLVREYGEELVGEHNNPALGMPLLVKFLDARQWLSVQVHPNDEQARELDDEPRGKSEAWYVVDAEPGAQLIAGIKVGVKPDDLREALAEERISDLLVYLDVRAGDVIPVSPGTVHALGPGIVIYEVQQSSDLTYRFYDWGRLGLDGKPRALHVEKSLAVTNLTALPDVKHTGASTDDMMEIVRTPYFRTELHQFLDGRMISFTCDPASDSYFDVLTCIEGRAVIEADGVQVVMEKGQTVLIPAWVPEWALMGRARVLRSIQVGS